MAHMDGITGKEKKKIENCSEKRISVIHTDSVVMKGIESFVIYRAYGRRSFYFLMGRAVRMGVYMFRAYSILMGRQHVFPSTGPGMELRTAFLLFFKTYTVVRDIISGGQQHVFLYTVHTLRLTHIWSSAFFLYKNINHCRKEKK